MDPFPSKHLALDAGGFAALMSWPLWSEMVGDPERAILFVLAVVFGVLRIMAAYRDLKRSDRRGSK